MGIPTVMRKVSRFTYLKGTLESIVQETSDKEKENIIVLIFVADFNETQKAPIIKYIQIKYGKHLNSGFMQIMQIHQTAYPRLHGLKHNYNDSEHRVQWRSKQAADFAFMFYYGRTLSQYYLQLEDDVTCAANFTYHIKEFIRNQRKPWVGAALLIFRIYRYHSKIFNFIYSNILKLYVFNVHQESV